MKHIGKFLFLICLFVYTNFFSSINAQPFINEIKAFQKSDSISIPTKNAILFAGSSSFRLWKNVQADFADFTIINRGFGGSTLPDVIRYTSEILFPYFPKQVVIYCGENDFAFNPTLSSDSVIERFKVLFTMIRNRLPKTHIAFVSMKPSPSRWKMKDQMVEANLGIKRYLKKQRRTAYIDIWTPMLTADGKPQINLFLGDMLHMNVKGYAIWKEAILPVLIK